MRDETELDVGEAVQVFWEAARNHARLNPAPAYFGRTPLETVPPPAWSFGGTQEQAGELAALVLDGRKTATASALWDYEAEDEPLPKVGQMSIVLDGHQRPVALIVTTEVATVPFDRVDAEHAEAEGEGTGRSITGARRTSGSSASSVRTRGISTLRCRWFSNGSGCSIPSRPRRASSQRAEAGRAVKPPKPVE
ncbi:ASCH domain-containing protein [Barrientosiimonas endolithica]|uniref:ASCH domain-containing protein n=1 Tax=Barrientosiimonas endolithica TaxID=1535208 RepID=A0ABM8H9T3_9MICO|nr:hypothetical protein GCM10025872_13370 [Barrientosiimonas endolithica]